MPSRLPELGPAPLLIGHRGARAFAPENTLPAIERAAEFGCAMVEIDVHLSRDGVPVVHHDDTLRRCSDVAERFPDRADAWLSDFTLAELQSLDAGSWYLRELALPAAQRQPFLRTLSDEEMRVHLPAARRAAYGGGRVRLPTLLEVLDAARSLGLAVNVEIKAIPRLYPGIAARVLEDIERSGLRERVLVSSFDHEQLVALRALDASLALGVLVAERLARPERYLALLDADAYHPGCSGESDSLGFHSVAGTLDTRGIDAVRAAGRGVFVWTCNDAAQMRALAAAGVSGIITDYPNRFPFPRAATSRP